MSHCLDVFLTVDTEFFTPSGTRPTSASVEEAIQTHIYGDTAQGEFGLRFQIEKLNAHGLPAVYFVESLCPRAVGMQPLREIVTTIQSGGHDVQMHLHPEWLSMMDAPLVPRTGQFLKDFTLQLHKLPRESSGNDVEYRVSASL